MERCWAVVAVAVLLAAVGHCAEPRPEQDDADLNDVVLLGRQRAWIVGDQGAVWTTADAGRSFQFVAVPVSASWQSACFLTNRVGWIAGRRSEPERGRGVLLATRDGGHSWQTHDLPLPAICHVTFFDLDHGVVVGGAAADYPAGIAETHDGGRSWRAVAGDHSTDWRCAAFFSPQSGVLAGRRSRTAAWDGQSVRQTTGGLAGRRAWQAVAVGGDGSGWLVGDGASVLFRPGGRSSWETVATPLPVGLGHVSNFHAVAVAGKRAWLAGTPGTVIWSTPDGGASWQRQTTGQTLPLSALACNESGFGIAAGGLGTIVVTQDGGRHWRVVRGNRRRLAVLTIQARAAEVPLGLLVRDSGESGYRSRAVVVPRIDRPGEAERLEKAIHLLGGSGLESGWRLSVDRPELGLRKSAVLADWQSQAEGHLAERLRDRLVGLLRTWRPSVVVVDQPSADDHVARIVREAVDDAITLAADPNGWSGPAGLTGLPAWSVVREVERLPGGRMGELRIDPYEFLPRYGFQLRSAVQRALLVDPRRSMTGRAGGQFHVVAGRAIVGGNGVCLGLGLAPGTSARRMSGTAVMTAGAEAARRQARAIEAFLRLSDHGGRPAEAVVAELEPLLGKLDRGLAGWQIWGLARRMQDRQRPRLARDLLRDLVSRDPEHEVAAAALAWLLERAVSEEYRWQRLRSPAGRRRVGAGADWRIQARQADLDEAVQWARLLRKRSPDRYESARTQLVLAAMLRARGSKTLAEAYSRRLAGRPGPWQRVARMEEWLIQPRGTLPPRSVSCRWTQDRPVLDGILSDSCWEQSAEVQLLGPGGRRPVGDYSFALLAGDAEYLYLAASLAGSSVGTPAAKAGGDRQHDAELAGQDRLRFSFDVDRDYASCYQLEVDWRGQLSERCGRQTGWNPRCFVAVDRDAEGWRVEMAIPWKDLAAARPAVGDHWAMQVVRTLPAVGWESWGGGEETPVTAPAGFGLLSFPRGSPARTSR